MYKNNVPPKLWSLALRFATKSKEHSVLLWSLLGGNLNTKQWLLRPSLYTVLSVVLDLCSLYLLIPLTYALSQNDFSYKFFEKVSRFFPSNWLLYLELTTLSKVHFFWILFTLIILTKILQILIDQRKAKIICERDEGCSKTAVMYCSDIVLQTSDIFLQRQWQRHAETIDSIPQLTKNTFAYIESAFAHSLRLALYIIVLLRIAPTAALVTFCAFPISASATIWFRARLMAKSKEQIASARSFREILRDTLEHSTLIKVNSRERWASSRLQDAIATSAAGQRAESVVASKFESVQSVTILICSFLVALAVMLPTPDAKHFASQLFLCFYLLSSSLPLASQLGRLRVSKDLLRTKLEVISDLIAEAGSHKRLNASQNVTIINSGITLSDVTYEYKNGLPVLKEANATFKAGQITFLFGASGAGKTTILNLIAGLLEPKKGQILIDDIDLSTIDLNSFHSNLSFVEQDPTLLLATFRENLLFGNERKVSDIDIFEILKELSLLDLVKSFSDGLDHIVDRGGRTFSRGQRQRLTIARAILKNPSIMLLDEPTTGLDQANIKAFVGSLKSHCSKATIILATHHLIPGITPDLIWKIEDHKILKKEN